MNDHNLTLEDIEFIKILANSEASLLEAGMNDDIRAKNIGIIYQDKNLLSDFTAIENVYLPNLLLSNDQTSSIPPERIKFNFL